MCVPYEVSVIREEKRTEIQATRKVKFAINYNEVSEQATKNNETTIINEKLNILNREK